MIVYGGCIEPGGMELEDEEWEDTCPKCGAPARHRYVQRLEGGCIDPYFPINCDSCGHREGYWDM